MNKSTLIHVAGEAIVVGGVTYICISKLKTLEQECKKQSTELTHIAKYIQEMLNKYGVTINTQANVIKELQIKIASYETSISAVTKSHVDMQNKVSTLESKTSDINLTILDLNKNINSVHKELSDAYTYAERLAAIQQGNSNDIKESSTTKKGHKKSKVKSDSESDDLSPIPIVSKPIINSSRKKKLETNKNEIKSSPHAILVSAAKEEANSIAARRKQHIDELESKYR